MEDMYLDEMAAASPENDRYTEAFAKYRLEVDEQTVKSAVERIRKDAEKENVKAVWEKILSCIDLTSLKPTDSDESILDMVEKINRFWGEHPEVPSPAAVCVYPCFAGLVSKSLELDGTGVACVAGGFPSSLTFTEMKIAEVSLAIHEGADEIDIVQPAGRFLSGEYEYIADETDEIKEVCGEHTLKVIIECGALGNLSNIKKASVLAMYSGADFIKTSTGKEVSGASPEAFYCMCKAIREYADETDRKVGIKAAGGISTIEDAVLYYTIAKKVLGSEWLEPDKFRIGASRLTGKLIEKISGEKSPF